MKKFIVLGVVATLTVWLLGPAMVLGTVSPSPTPNVDTGLTRGSGGGQAPVIKVKWEMWDQGKDDSTDAGAQFLPPGIWGNNLNYKVCAIATDPNGAADIKGVYADIYYPEGIAIHDKSPSTDVHRDPANGDADCGEGGCGAFIEENTLVKMTKDAGFDLFCNKIRTNNTNLPTFASPYTYDEICKADGELMKETAYVYCDAKTLKWEDPAGMYTVEVFALDQGGNSSATLYNDFEYLPLTAFEKDFSNVNYGNVMLDTDMKVSGDLTFGSGDPTIRNTGNTRLWMSIAQDDMGLGQSSGVWNVKYDARVGNHLLDWSPKYNPFKLKADPKSPIAADYTRLEDILDLSETEEMDFSIKVTKWPNTETGYSGNMWLKADPAPFRDCNS